jgi:hypothetical protein
VEPQARDLTDDPHAVVHGRVTSVAGRPVAGVTVRAFDRALRHEQALGESRTNENGDYEIAYRKALLARADRDSADLMMRVFDGPATLYETPVDAILWNAPDVAVVDIVVAMPGPPVESEYERILEAVSPLLDGAALDGLREDAEVRDITFLAGETGIGRDQLTRFAVAQKLATAGETAAELFYALLAENTLLKADLASAGGIRFEIGLGTEIQPLLYDAVLLPAAAVTAAAKQAVTDHFVPASLLQRLDDLLKQLAKYLPAAQAYVREERTRQVFGQVERFLAAGKHEKVLAILQENAYGDLPGLLQRLQEAAVFAGPASATAATTGVALADVLGFNDQIIERARARQGIARPEEVRRLARLDHEDWKALLQESAASVKVGDHALRQDLIDLHAAALVRRLEQRFPTTAFAAQLERDPAALPAQREAVLGLLAGQPDFDLATGNVELSLAQDSAPKEAVKAAQRVFKIAPTFRQARVLLESGVHSAAGIHAMGETRFVNTFAATGAFTPEEAKTAFHKAADIHAASALLAGELQATAAALKVTALGAALPQAKLDAVTKDFPNIKSLFQLADYCACQECRTVHSAAAYVVDALQFLKNRLVVDTTAGPPVSVKIAKDVLFARRSDLGDTDLSCDNTNTPLPYIDVVCELLEEAVAPDPGVSFTGTVAAGLVSPALLAFLQGNGFPFTGRAAVYEADLAGNFVVRDAKVVCKLSPAGGGTWLIRRLRQTYGAPGELSAAPEYVNEAAYTTLGSSPFAFTLPFDLSHQETRSYLAQAGVGRGDLMTALRTAAGPQDGEIAAEELGLSDEERKLVVTADPGNQKIYWNTGGTPPADVIKVVDTFLTKTGLAFADLQELLIRAWINPGNALFIRSLDNSCELTKKEIENLDAAALDRLHRFIRLWQKTGWTTAALDRAIRASRLGNGALDDACLVHLERIGQLQAKLGLAVDELCNLYDVIPADGPGSRYAQLFLSPAANGPVNDDFLPEKVHQNELDELAVPGSGKKLSAYKTYLALCLGAKAADADRWVDSLGAAAILSAANIAAVYALNLLARTLHLSAADFLIVRGLTGIDPLAAPANTLDYFAGAAKVRASGVRPADLQYLLIHEAENLAARVFGDGAITALLASLQGSYQAAFAANRSPFAPAAAADENKNALRDLLAKLPTFAEADLSRFQTILDDSWQDPVLTPAAYIDQQLSAFVDTAPIKAAQAALGGAAPPKEVERNALIQSIADALSAYFYGAAKEGLLTAAVVKSLKLAEDVAMAVLRQGRLQQPAAAGKRTLLDLLTDDALIDRVGTPPVPPAIVPVGFDNQFRALRLLHTVSLLLGNLQLAADRVAWMLANNAALGWLQLDDLMYQAGIAPVPFAAWAQLQDALYLVKTYPPVDNPSAAANPFTFYGLLDLVLAPGTAAGDLLAYLATLAGWDAGVLTALDARFGLSSVNLAPYRLPATYLRLEAAVTLLRRLGLETASGVSLIKPKLAAADAALMRQALKSRYEEPDWLGVLQNVQDRLRMQKRDALVAFLLAVNPPLRTSDDLYDYFLIDVEMCSCMPTSRIVQAHATIQLFVQRCLMGLEPRSVANLKEDASWERWKWMANFRVWEANRKIFLYPENWIEPELRDDKSELFKALENTLQQDELSDSAVEEATSAYLEGLDDIAQMDVMATYYQTDVFTLHVFARTKGGDPAVYYYRQLQKERSWTPWERVNLDIAGDHLLAFDRNSRLTLAWPVFTEEADDSQTTMIPNPGEIPKGGKAVDNKPYKRWKIQLAVSERSGSKWLPKKVSKDALYSPAGGYFFALPEVSSYNFFAWSLGAAGQAISCSNQGKGWIGSFALTGCKGYPEPTQGGGGFLPFLPQFRDTTLRASRFLKDDPNQADDLAIKTIFNLAAFDPIVQQTPTPGPFKVTYPLQMSLIDWIFLGLEVYQSGQAQAFAGATIQRSVYLPLGTFMPYFYGDISRTYVIIPGFYQVRAENPKSRAEEMFSDILQFVEDVIALIAKYLQKYQQDPAHDLNKLLQQLVADPEFTRLQAELAVYQTLQFGLKFKNFYHPLICLLRTALNRGGIPALMQRDLQLTDTGFDFGAVYNPAPLVVTPYPREDVDFDRDGAYSSYNWELFFHIPFEIAMRLNQDQQFEAARAWFHYVFNPVGATDAPAPQKYWITKPFFQTTVADYLSQRIDNILFAIAADPAGATITDLKFAVSEWRDKPFRPHVIARSRPVAYQLALVVRYIGNLVDWGDNLFGQFTRESVTQATQLYILADKLLGPKPRIVPPAVTPPVETYNQLEAKVDLFGNALLDLENLIPDLSLLPHGGAELPPSPITVSALYFCIPPNDNLLQVWDRVADRLFKIRHCQNSDGVESILALFSPPIDPGALVRAAAAGLDVSSFLAGLSAPLPSYRFNVMSQKAGELTQQVSGLGNSLLQALEKRDAEKLARLRSAQELAVLGAVRAVKLAAIAEAQGSVEGLQKSRKVTEERRSYYAGQSFMNPWEITAVSLSGASLIGEAAIALGYILSGGLKLIPDFMTGGAGFGGSPTVTLTIGGTNTGASAESAVQTLSSIIRALDKGAAMAATQGSYQHRKDDWDFQVRLADKELAQIDQQIATANLHLDMLSKDLAAHDLQIANAQQTDEFLHAKYTNQELYDWMIGQVSAVYFQAYKLAFDVAKKAERCFRHELGGSDTFLAFGYWDSLKKGLMTADALFHDIKRMEVAYLEKNKREYELTKHVSLAQLDPAALVRLKSTGKCIVQVPEAIFDLDHPGQYMRRHKSVSLSIPCVAGPYTSVSCKLSLVNNRYRKSTALRQGVATDKEKYEEQAGNDERFVYNVGTIQSIATSSGQTDSGLFELNFRDERYLPFEGTGAAGTWQIELPAAFRQLDYGTISDVILHLRYTARDGGSAFRSLVEGVLGDLLKEMVLEASHTGLYQAYNLGQQFPNEWWHLKQTKSAQLTLGSQHLPFFVQGHSPAVDAVTWFARVNGNPAIFVLSLDAADFALGSDSTLASLCVGSSTPITLGTAFTLAAADTSNLEELTMLVHYTISS